MIILNEKINIDRSTPNIAVKGYVSAGNVDEKGKHIVNLTHDKLGYTTGKILAGGAKKNREDNHYFNNHEHRHKLQFDYANDQHTKGNLKGADRLGNAYTVSNISYGYKHDPLERDANRSSNSLDYSKGISKDRAYLKNTSEMKDTVNTMLDKNIYKRHKLVKSIKDTEDNSNSKRNVKKIAKIAKVGGALAVASGGAAYLKHRYDNLKTKKEKEEMKNKLKAGAIGAGVAAIGSKLVNMHKNKTMDKYNAKVFKQASVVNDRLERLKDTKQFGDRVQASNPFSMMNARLNPGSESLKINKEGINDKKTIRSIDRLQKHLDDRHKSHVNHSLAKGAAIVGGLAAGYGAYKYLKNKKKKKLLDKIKDN